MSAAPIHFQGERLMLDPLGAAFWPARRTLIVADLHLEKGSAAAARGSLLPPFDTRATLDKLHRLARLYRPARIIALGDSFHDTHGPRRLSAEDKARLTALAGQAEFIWIAGNHDAAPPASGQESDFRHESVATYADGPFVFRHQAQGRRRAQEVEISGHYHPKASVSTRALRVSRPCFVSDGTRLILPAFGAFTGGLDVRDPAIAGLFPRGLRVFLLGRERLYAFALAQVA